MKNSPQIFDLTDLKGANPRVISFGLYYEGLIQNLGQRGLCAQYDGESLHVKKTNAFDDSYTVLASTGFVRQGPNSYSATCRPASFPVGSSSPPPGVPGCALGGSIDIACSPQNPVFLGVMQSAILTVTQQDPSYFDFNDIENGSDLGYKVLNAQGYLTGVATVLQARGFCTVYRSDAMSLKNSNTLSESYHILTGQNYLRRDLGSYQQTCYPAAF